MKTYRIFIHTLDAFIDTDFETAREAFLAAERTLARGLHFSIHPCIDGDTFASVLDGVSEN